MMNKHKANTRTKQLKIKKHEELIPVAWHPTRQYDWCMLQDEKKETDLVFTKKVEK